MEQRPSWEANQSLQLVKNFPRFYGTRKSLTILTSARHLSLSWANSIQSPRPRPTVWRSNLILSSYLRLGLPTGLFPSDFPTNTLCTPLSSSISATCPAHVILLDFTTRTILGKVYQLNIHESEFDHSVSQAFDAIEATALCLVSDAPWYLQCGAHCVNVNQAPEVRGLYF
jgi:hypothetical protein